MVVYEVACEQVAYGADADRLILAQLAQVLASLKQTYTRQENVSVHLNLCTPTFYPSWWCERFLFLARQQVAFPVPVCITQDAGPAAQERYIETSTTLRKFRTRMRQRRRGGEEEGGDQQDDVCDYETVLKLAILRFSEQNAIEEALLEQMLAQNHCLEELLGCRDRCLVKKIVKEKEL